jgi:hypothetical protein
VRELLAKELAKHPPGALSKATVDRLLNEWTLDYYFDQLGHEVTYRPTPAGPEVLAVGFEEVLALKKSLSLEEQLKLKAYLGY